MYCAIKPAFVSGVVSRTPKNSPLPSSVDHVEFIIVPEKEPPENTYCPVPHYVPDVVRSVGMGKITDESTVYSDHKFTADHSSIDKGSNHGLSFKGSSSPYSHDVDVCIFTEEYSAEVV